MNFFREFILQFLAISYDMTQVSSQAPKYENPLFEKKIRKQGRRTFTLFTVVLTSVICLLFILSLILFRSPASFISLAIISGNTRHSDEEITKRVNEVLSGSLLGLYPKKNIYLSPIGSVQEKLKQTFYYEKVTIEKIYSQRALHIIVTEQPLEYVVFYGDSVRYVTHDGTLLERITDTELQTATEEHIGIRLPETLIQRDQELSKDLIAKSILEQVRVLSDAFQKSFGEDKLDFVEYTSDSAQDIKIHTVNGWYVYLDASKPIQEQIKTAHTVFTNNIKGTEVEQTLDYIDVRVESRAYYK